jgi:Cell division protein CrgA
MATPDPSPSAKRTAKSGPGRFTPKGSKDDVVKRTGAGAKAAGKAAGKAALDQAGEKAGEKLPAYASSGRVTKPAERTPVAVSLPTRAWVPVVMFALLILGGLMIVLNYVDVLPNSPSNWYLLGGIVAITGGFITATQLK